MAAFAPKGQIAEWRKVYDVLRELQIGDVLRYDALDEILGRSFISEGAKRNPLERARRELEDVDRRTLAAVPRVGYRVVEPREHMSLASGHQRRSRRQLTRAQQKLESTEIAALTDLERRRHDAMMGQVSHLLSEQRRVARRLARIEEALDSARGRTSP
jgi:DNA-binding winged helix-turn-helix (wHTH) protein